MHVAANVNGQLLIFGGLNDSYAIFSDTSVLNLGNNNWTSIAGLAPSPRFSAAFTSINDSHVIVFGGLTGALKCLSTAPC